MKTVKMKIIASFCSTVFVILAIVVVAVSWKLSSSIAYQSGMLEQEMTVQANSVVVGHHNVLKSYLETRQKDISRSKEAICENPRTLTYLESQQIKTLENLLKNSCERSNVDWAIVYDLNGQDQASYPPDILAITANEFYDTSELSAQVKGLLLEEIEPDNAKLDAVLKFDVNYLEAFRLDRLDASGTGGIVIASAGIVRDDFGDPIASVIIGKILNNYDWPLKLLNQSTNSASALYINTTPIAHFGFNRKDRETIDDAGLQMDSNVLDKIYASGKPINIDQTLAGEKYLTACSTITSMGNEKIGVILAATPEKQIVETKQLMLSLGIKAKRTVQQWLFAIGIISLILFLVISLLIANSIAKPLNQVIEGLRNASNQVAYASEHISSSNKQLAKGSSMQVASIEETSSALEEMATMTIRNSSDAGQADILMKDVNQVVAKANDSMAGLTASMEEISRASEETSRIIKTIDEIAFQTNLLALNAAVEAARAGNAGAGFAVVADEVRNLAMRAADAAKDTANLIGGTAKKADAGKKLVFETNETLGEVAASVTGVSKLVAQIASGSNEQSQGITLISEAMTQADKMVQQNASNADESVVESKNMNAQANQLKQYIHELEMLVSGKTHKSATTLSSRSEPGRLKTVISAIIFSPETIPL